MSGDGSGMPHMTPEKMANMPLMRNPSGQPPNFDHPDSNGPAAISVMAVFLGLATLSVCLRMWSRIMIVKHIGLDDASAIVGLLCVGAMVGLITYRKLLILYF